MPSLSKCTLLGVMLLLCLTLLAGGKSACLAQGSVSTSEVPNTVDSKIVPGSVLRITLVGEEDFSGDYPVDSRGCVKFRLTDSAGKNATEWEVKVSGMTASEARNAVIKSCMEFFKMPEVTLVISKVPGLKVEISGEVNKPGNYSLPIKSRLSDLFRMGELRNTADLSKILIRRVDTAAKGGDGRSVLNIDFTQAGADGSDTDPTLQNGDKVYLFRLPEIPIPKELHVVRIMGEIRTGVKEVKGAEIIRDDGVLLPLMTNMTVKEVFHTIGGVKDTADRRRIYLGRMDGKTAVLSLDKIEADDPEHNLVLKPGDMIIVQRKDRSVAFAVLGEVNAVGTFEMLPGQRVKVLDAIQKAGGFTKKSDTRRAILSRGYLLDPARAQSIPFDPDLVKQGKQPNMELDPGDAIIIMEKRKKPTLIQQLAPLLLRFLPIPF